MNPAAAADAAARFAACWPGGFISTTTVELWAQEFVKCQADVVEDTIDLLSALYAKPPSLAEVRDALNVRTPKLELPEPAEPLPPRGGWLKPDDISHGIYHVRRMLGMEKGHPDYPAEKDRAHAAGLGACACGWTKGGVA